jgi:hypothetical protein
MTRPQASVRGNLLRSRRGIIARRSQSRAVQARASVRPLNGALFRDVRARANPLPRLGSFALAVLRCIILIAMSDDAARFRRRADDCREQAAKEVMTRRRGRISATMVCGILAKRNKEERLKRSRSFSISIPCSKLFMLDTRPENSPLGFSFGRLSWRALSFLWTVFSVPDANSSIPFLMTGF